MNESFSKSENIMELAMALSKAQVLIEKASKDSINPHFKSKYADLANVVDAIKPAIAQHQLSFIQVCNDKNDYASISTIIIHSSGQWINCGAVSVPVDKKNAQGYGSALTYARRYSLASAFGVAADDDDDGNSASQKRLESKNINHPKEKNLEDYKFSKDEINFATSEQTALLIKLSDKLEKGDGYIQKVIKVKFGHEDLTKIPKKFADEWQVNLQKRFDETQQFVKEMDGETA